MLDPGDLRGRAGKAGEQFLLGKTLSLRDESLLQALVAYRKAVVGSWERAPVNTLAVDP